MSDTTGRTLGGLLGPSTDDETRKRLGIEQPSPLAGIGRGFMDLWEPLRQSYLNVADPNQARAYQAQRAGDERLYQRGLLAGGDPTQNQAGVDSDFWRMIGRTAPMGLAAPLLPAALPEAAMSTMLTTGTYDALGTARKRYGLAPWLELPTIYK